MRRLARYTEAMLHLRMRKKKRIAAIIDIGTSSAAVAIVQVNVGTPSTVIAFHRIFFGAGSEKKNSPESIASLVREAGARVKAELEKKRDHAAIIPHSTYIFSRAPWSHSATHTVVDRFPEDIKITSSEIDERAEKVLAGLSENENAKLLEASVMRIEVNGYPTPRPIGKRGHILKATILASDVDLAFKSAVSEAVMALFPKIKPEWRTHTRAIMGLLREHPANFRDAIVADIASEGSDFIVVKDGVIAQQVATTECGNSILGRIATGSMHEETLTLLRMFERDRCATDVCNALKERMGHAEIDLVKVFGDVFAKMAASGRLPTKMLLCTIPDMAPWMSRFLSRIDFSQFTITAQPFSISIVNPESLTQWVVAETGIVVDVSLLLACTLVHIENEAPNLK